MATSNLAALTKRVQTIVITGAAGEIARLTVPRLARPGRLLRLVDINPLCDWQPAGDFESHTASITDLNVLTELFAGADAVINLAGQSYESAIEDVLHANVYGTYCVLEAARRAGIHRVVLASSNHTVGFYPRNAPGPQGLPTAVRPRPDTFYGWSKVAAEALAQLYADRFHLDVFSIRIGKCAPSPPDLRSLALWLSPSDATRLVEACLTTTQRGHRVIWGVSHNSRRFMSLAEGQEIGFQAGDDSEIYAASLLVHMQECDAAPIPNHELVGGHWCITPLGESNRPNLMVDDDL